MFLVICLTPVYPRFSVFFQVRARRGRRGAICYLEAEKWSESYPQIVVRPVVKVHFIAHIEPQANWPDPSLEASSGVKSGVHILSAEVIHRTGEGPRGCWSSAEVVIHKSALREDKRVEASVAQVEFWPKLSMQNPHVGALGRNGAGAVVGKAFGKDSVAFRLPL